MTLEFQLNGGKKINLTYQEAELMYKDLQRIFGQPQVHFRPPTVPDSYPRGYPKEVPGTWCGSNPVDNAVAHTAAPGVHYRDNHFQTQKEALAEIRLNGEAH